MRHTLAALGLAAFAGTTMLSAASAAEPQKAAIQQVADMRPAPDGMQGPRGHGPDMRGDRQGPRGGMEDRRGNREMRLAEQLSGAETLIGVRVNQIDAWRDYTTALLALIEPPAPLGPIDGASNGDKAFAREERLAREITERAAKAATLTKAITVLKTTLSPEQLDKLASIDLRLAPPRGPDMGPGMRPDMAPGMGRGHGMRQGPGPDDRMGEDGGRGGFHRGPGPGGPSGPGGNNALPDDGNQPDDAPTPG